MITTNGKEPAIPDRWRENNVQFQGKVFLGEGVRIGPYCVIGYSEQPAQAQLLSTDEESATSIGDKAVIYPFSIVHEGAKLGSGVVLDAHSAVGAGTKIGTKTRIVYGAKLYEQVSVGSNAIVSGFCCDGSRIGSDTTMMGNLVHKVTKPITNEDWDRGPQLEGSPVIGNHVLVGFNATIVGSVKIEDDAVVGAGAVVLENVPRGVTVVGVPAKPMRDKETR
jgi:UDP-3-O-[3-hydroxymyristoyl] glucosamine N-acyltransferase